MAVITRTCCVAVVLSLTFVAIANPIPAFARRYGVSCNLCHHPVPRLNAFGEVFAGNGFRMSPVEAPRGLVETGDDQLALLERLPLAFRLDAYVRSFANGDFQTDFETPYNLKVLSGGPITDDISYYLYFFLFERGEVGGIEDAFIFFNDVVGQSLDVAVGQFQISDPIFKRELRLEFQDYAVYRARLGDVPSDLLYDRGVMITADVAGFTVTGELVNGNGKGEALENRRFDNDAPKNPLVHVSRELLPQLRLGGMYYNSRVDATLPSGQDVRNVLWMVGADATLSLGDVEINAQYLHREDDRPTFTPGEPLSVTDGGFLEVLYAPLRSKWYATALYNRVDASRPLLNVRLGGAEDLRRYEAITGGLGYSVARNFRAMAELTWDLEAEAADWVFGLVTAF